MLSSAVANSFKGKTALVTGGTGLIGREVVRILTECGAKVRSVSLDEIKEQSSVEYVFGDLRDFEFCKKITKDIDFVFHIAGIKGSVEVTKSKPASFFVNLLMMNTNLLEAARLAGAQKVVYTSSIGAYPSAEVFCESEEMESGEPMDMFPGWAKRMAELQIKAYKIQYQMDNFAVVRPSNVYGPGDNFDPANAMVIPTLMHRIHSGENPVVVWGDGSAVRDFAFSEDLAKGVILALYHGTGGRYLNLGSGEGFTIKELVETLHQVTPFNYKFDTSKPSGFPKRIMDISLARKMIGYNPSTSLLDGLRKTWTWYVANQDQYLKRKNYFKD